ncbi:hypothetical protein LTR10_015162 [Elasticomyces elasticus]|uniref:Altered inheritance of mitochondria protein 13, mitochondrial n=1 Tax=Exophiala sideris TaxID=1016849 RepID=A0ABR0JE96_9EURO|nr:hypothetical protein LTR10_015162 [Elasticomyces elasticus]KAK5032635.1 hypothetical protein LTS07_004045 [Exophiala sideris]KAK5062160.1 hypothetical protein LTR69_004518 [Exophiala sideris]KAK5182342.1 hypothetical protein LTR44_005353 [Eurotiomycetes sp. CCFEE 6388]
MGAGQSKPDESTKHVFASDTPIQFSQELIDALEASSETNSTRAKTLELHIAQRVASELEKLKKHESSVLEEARKKILESSDEKSDSGSEGSKGSLLSIPSISPSDLLESKEDKTKKNVTSTKVQEEIEKLRQTLDSRKVLKEVPGEVEAARQDVISCLRVKDRQPLDCWKEVEIFKRAVRRMEESYVASML